MHMSLLVTWFDLAFLFLGYLLYRWGYLRGAKAATLSTYLPQWRLNRAVENAIKIIEKQKDK